MRVLRCSVDDIKAQRAASAVEFEKKIAEISGNMGPSQKQSVIRSLEQGIAAVERQVVNMKESNEHLRLRIKGLSSLIAANGLEALS
jgi:hypothetical protein